MSKPSWRWHVGCFLALAAVVTAKADLPGVDWKKMFQDISGPSGGLDWIAPAQATRGSAAGLPEDVRRKLVNTRVLLAGMNFGKITWEARQGQCMAVFEDGNARGIKLADCSDDRFQFFAAPERGSTGSLQWALDLQLCVQASREAGIVSLTHCADGDERQKFAVIQNGDWVELALVQSPELCLGVLDAGDILVTVSCSEVGAHAFLQSNGGDAETPPPSQPDPVLSMQETPPPSQPDPVQSVQAQEPVADELPPERPHEAKPPGCVSSFQRPPPPLHASDHNGVQLEDVCIPSERDHHVFVIGDWGGVGIPDPQPADARTILFGAKHRRFVTGVDDQAQQRVARMFNAWAAVRDPDYIINVGDNFYWGGVTISCGQPSYRVEDSTGQWTNIFENIYHGPGVDGKPWLGVLGNHDYGGYMFTNGWDQVVGYTWTVEPPSTNRWLTPAQYWASTVRYPDSGFSIDYYFIDSNIADVQAPDSELTLHNICSREHNPAGATCGAQGPTSVDDCPNWFQRLWDEQSLWLTKLLAASRADWQVLVTHFPTSWNPQFFKVLAKQYGIDLIIAGHVHNQHLSFLDDGTSSTLHLVSGGGGGITSEAAPEKNGDDDQYGFMDITFTKEEVMVEAISHGGYRRKVSCMRPRPAQGASQQQFAFHKRQSAPQQAPLGSSLCHGKVLGPIVGLAPSQADDLEETQFV